MSVPVVLYILFNVLDIFLYVYGQPTVILIGNSSLTEGDSAYLKSTVIPEINITSVLWQKITMDEDKNISVSPPKYAQSQVTSGGTIVITLKIISVSANDEANYRVVVESEGKSYVSNQHKLNVFKDDSNCEPGKFGDKSEKDCKGNCANNAICDPTSGYCPGDCIEGWEGKLCDKECKDGFYGVNCRQTCSGHCVDGETCGRFKGHCRNGCADGWAGMRCNEAVPKTETSTSQTPGSDLPSFVLYVALTASSIIILGAGVTVLVCCVRKKQGERRSSTNSDKNTRSENHKIFFTDDEIYDSIYEEQIEEKNERPPSYHAVDHVYDTMKRDPVNDYIEIIE